MNQGTARHGTAGHVERLVSHYRRTNRLQALQEENRSHALRELSWYTDDDGMWVLNGRLSAEQGVLIRKVLEGVMEELDTEQKDEPEGVSAETPEGIDLCEAQPHPVAVRRSDALERIAESYVARQSGDRGGGDRYMVNIHTEADTLKADGESAESELEEYGCVSAETLWRWRQETARTGWTSPRRPLHASGRVSRWTTIWRFWGFRVGSEGMEQANHSVVELSD